ncbi:hypothetical protein PAXRUDRAFT_15368 [Paxillus rubicundulus Ve08.2h10]|uniref:Uncharacterized protein n=1 Tax=Paxillus rubicundulus Ve08.2h10 TaxID=930991 RepID=A0A0D0DI46_9AGAM|nr:hypothetical protein PAXRUDRAFT_15368 [Paxillus rubicundulus Ve08.2h10]
MLEYQCPDGIAVAIWDALPDDMKQRIAAGPAQGGQFAVDPRLLRPTHRNHDANHDRPHEDMGNAWQRIMGESEPARGAQPSRGSCGGICGRGAATAAKKHSRRQGRNFRAAEDLDVEADAEVGDNQVIFDDDAEDVTTASSQLLKPARKACKELRKLITAKFRKLCNVAEKQKWPSVEEKRVNTTTGEKIFDHVADQVWLDLKSKMKPDYLTSKKIRWEKTSLESFAKQMFRGFKPEWMAQKNGKAAKKKSKEQ